MRNTFGVMKFATSGKEWTRNDTGTYIFRTFSISCFAMACSLYGVADDKGRVFEVGDYV